MSKKAGVSKSDARQSYKNKGYYERQFFVTARNKERRRQKAEKKRQRWQTEK